MRTPKHEVDHLLKTIERDMGGRIPPAVRARLIAQDAAGASFVGDVLSDRDEPWDKDDEYTPYALLFRKVEELCGVYREGQASTRRTRDETQQSLRLTELFSVEDVARFQALEAYRRAEHLPANRAGSQVVIAPDAVHGATVAITVPLWLKSETIQRIYKAAQNQAGAWKPRARIGVKMIAFIQDVVVGAAGLLWRERMRRWNQQHPMWRYDNPLYFWKDCRRAKTFLLPEKSSPGPTVVRPIGRLSAHAQCRAHAVWTVR